MIRHRPSAYAALVAAGLGRLAADAIVLRSLAGMASRRADAAAPGSTRGAPDALRGAIADTLALIARHCIRLGGALPSRPGELLPMSAIPRPPLDPAAAPQALTRGLCVFLEDIETVALLAEAAGDVATCRLLRDRRAVLAAFLPGHDGRPPHRQR